MNDRFLDQLREDPDPGFAEDLRRRLIQSSSANRDRGAKVRLFLSQLSSVNRRVLTTVASGLAFALLLVISPTVRVAVTGAIETIIVKGTTVWIYDDVPLIRGESETYSEIWTPLNQGDISTDYPDLARFPLWVPTGFLLQDRAALFGSMTKDMPYSVLGEWQNKHGDTIQLKVSKGSCPNGQVWESGEPRSDCAYGWGFNADSKRPPELIMVNNQPAILLPEQQILMDLSDPIGQWNPYRVKYDNRDPDAFFLLWESDGMRFELATRSRTISKKDLLRIAESIP